MKIRENTFVAQPLLLKSRVQHYAWGSRGDEAIIPRLLGEPADPDKPYAELWMGAHPKAPSMALYNGKWIPLNELIKAYPRPILGDAVATRFGELPFLFKVLSAGEPLSIQAHPSKEQANVLHEKDPLNYPDDNHKPEIAIALDRLTALVGFGKKVELVELLKRHSEITDFLGGETVAAFLQEQNEAQAIRLLYQHYLQAVVEEPARLEEAAGRLKRKISSLTSIDEKEALFISMTEKYGLRDIGLFSIFFLNLLHLKAGEAVFLGAGIPHAYVKGNIVECMANSDNVVRAGLTPKFQDVNALMEILDYGCQPVVFRDVDPDDTLSYHVHADEFCVSRRVLMPGKGFATDSRTVVLLFLVKGEAAVKYSLNEKIEWQKGQALLIPAAVGRVIVEAKRQVLFYEVVVPL